MKTKPRLIGLLCLTWAAPCFACYNDTAVERGEEQFRSQYNAPTPQVAAPTRSQNPWSIAAMCVGSALAAGSLLVAIDRHKKQPHEKAAD